MYRLTNDINIVIRLSDMVAIPKGHRWWDDYERWVLAGNVPTPVYKPTTEELSSEIRSKRNRLLRESDWTQLADNNLTGMDRTAWTSYRQLLRGVPQQAGFPNNIVWPSAPTISLDAGDQLPEHS